MGILRVFSPQLFENKIKYISFKALESDDNVCLFKRKSLYLMLQYSSLLF